MTRYFTIITLLLFFLPATAGAQKRKIDRAYEFYKAGEYYEAIDYFKDAYSKTKDKEIKADMVFMVSECYRMINDPKNAELWYKKAVRSGNARPEAQFWLASSIKKSGRYEQAIEEFRKYKQLAPTDPRADQEIRACELAAQWTTNPEAYKVEELKEVNSKDADFSPAFARDDNGVIYFTSSRDDATGNKTHGATGQNFTDIFETRVDKKGKWSLPVSVTALSGEAEDGTPSFTSDFREVFFTRCEAGKREARGCKIMTAQRKGDSWSEPSDIGILPDSLVAAHPAVSPDGLSLYFVSDMPGGFGGKDIWVAERANKSAKWSKPVNAGPDVNTSGDELFPYVRENNVLYFSSNGQTGMGGLDIFKALPQADGSWIVSNMKAPVNSFADDFGISFRSGEEAGVFSSTRKGKNNDEIYSFELPPLRFNITGLVRDEKTGTPITGSIVQLIASDGSNLQVETGTNGDFKFALKPQVDYIFLASKKGYLNGKEKETTKGLEKSRDFMVTLQLTPIDRPIELPNIFYDFGKWDLRPESMVSLDKLVETLNDNPNVTIELMSHTDSRDTEEYNQTLSQKRAQSVVDYLVSKGIEIERLTAKGYGESSPKVVDQATNQQNNFLRIGAALTEQYINSLQTEDQKEIAHQINRRTEFKVLRTDYISPAKN